MSTTLANRKTRTNYERRLEKLKAEHDTLTSVPLSADMTVEAVVEKQTRPVAIEALIPVVEAEIMRLTAEIEQTEALELANRKPFSANYTAMSGREEEELNRALLYPAFSVDESNVGRPIKPSEQYGSFFSHSSAPPVKTKTKEEQELARLQEQTVYYEEQLAGKRPIPYNASQSLVLAHSGGSQRSPEYDEINRKNVQFNLEVVRAKIAKLIAAKAEFYGSESDDGEGK